MSEERVIFRMDFEGGDKILEQIALIRKQTEELKEEKTRAAKAAKEGGIEEEKALERINIQIKENNKEVNALSRQYGANAKQVENNTGSLVAMRKQLRQMNAEYDGLTKAQRENEQVGGVLNKRIEELNKELVAAEESTGRYQRSVGKYQQSIEAAANSIGAKREELKRLKKEQEGIDPINDAEKFNKLRGEIDGLTTSIGVLSGEYDEFGNRAKRNPAAEELSTMADSAKGAMSSLALLNMFMGDNEDAARVQARAVQSMAIAQNAHNIAVGASKLPQTLAIARTKTMTIAQWALNVAMNANPIVKIVTLLALLGGTIWAVIANFETLTNAVQRAWRWMTPWVDRVDEATKSQDENTRSLQRQAQAQRDLRRELERSSSQMSDQISDMEHTLALMRARGDADRDILALERQIIQMRVDRAKADYEAAIASGETTDELINNWRRARRELELFEARQQRAAIDNRERNNEIHQDNEEAANEYIKLLEEQSKWQENRDLERLDAIDRFNHIERQKLLEKYENELITTAQYGELLINLESEIAARRARAREEAEQREEERRIQSGERERDQFLSWIEERQRRDETELERIGRQQQNIEDLNRRGLITDQELAAGQAEIAKDLAQAEWDAVMTRIQAQRAARDATAAAFDAISQSLAGGSKAMVNFARFTKSISLANTLVNIIQGFSASAKIGFPQNIVSIAGYIAQTAGLITQIRQIAIPSVPQYNTGGRVPGTGNRDTVPAMLTPGEGILRANAMNAGDNWTLSGTPKQIASTLNQAYGGVEFRNTGGIIGSTARTATRNAAEELSRENLVEAFKAIQIVTTVEDINARMSSEQVRNEIAEL